VLGNLTNGGGGLAATHSQGGRPQGTLKLFGEDIPGGKKRGGRTPARVGGPQERNTLGSQGFTPTKKPGGGEAPHNNTEGVGEGRRRARG